MLPARPMAGTLDNLIQHYGLIMVAIGAGAEGEAATILGGALAKHGLFSPYAAGLAAFIGAVIADNVLFQMARRHRNGRFVTRVRQKPLFTRAVDLVDRYPIACCVLFRFVYGLRIVGPVTIGLSRIPTARFVAIELLAAAIWASLFTTLGYLFGRVVDAWLRAAITPHRLALVIGIAALIGSGIAYRRRRRSMARETLTPRL